MAQVIYISAMIANLVAMATLVYLLFMEAHGLEDYLVISLMMIPPSFSIVAIYQRPDWEERKLTRQVNKAQLKKQLEELGG